MASDDLTEMAEELLRPAPSLAAMVTDRLRARIRGGHYELGSKVPSEAELMRAYGVSRTVVREALSALRDGGFLEIRQGKGSFVISRNANAPFTISADETRTLTDVLHILELRSVLEIEIAALAAERAAPETLAEIQSALADFNRSIAERGDGVEADARFHLAIAAASGNPHFPKLLQSFGNSLIARQRIQTQFRDDEDRQRYLAMLAAEHQDILDAISRNDSAAARKAMKHHLDGSRYRIMKQASSGGEAGATEQEA